MSLTIPMVALQFQSTLPRGERPKAEIQAIQDWIFQSTLPRGERPLSYHTPGHLSNFNPRSHEGSDSNTCHVLVLPLHFNPRSHEGSDRWNRPWLQSSDHFNPRSHEGSDVTRLSDSFRAAIFQSTLPRGERHFFVN